MTAFLTKPVEKVSMAAKLLVLVSFVTWLMGCATRPSLTTDPPQRCTIDYQAQLPEIRRVALVTDSKPPTIEAVSLGHTYGEGAAQGAKAGAAFGASFAWSEASQAVTVGSDPYAVTIFLLLLPVLVVGGGVVGTVAGTTTGHSADMLAAAEANAQAMLNSAYLQTEMLQRAQDYGLANIDLEFIQLPSVDSESRVDNQAHEDPSAQSFDAVLEVELLRIALKRSLKMEARTRLVSTRTGDILSENKHMFQTESRSPAEWTENGAAPLSEAIQEGLQTLAEDTIDKNFALFPQKGRKDQFTIVDSGNYINFDSFTDRIYADGERISKFSPAILNIPEGKSAVFVYRPTPSSHLDEPASMSIIINNKYLSKLPSSGFDCLIVEPGKNTLIYPSQFDDDYKNITIDRGSLETKRNEIAYFSVKSTLRYSVFHVSGDSVIENKAVDSLKGKRRGKMEIIKLE